MAASRYFWRPVPWRAWPGAWLFVALLFLVAPPASAQAAGEGCEASAGAYHAAATPPSDLSITYYGVSTLMFSDGRDHLLIDGFFTRPPVWKLLFFWPIDSAPEAIAKGLDGREHGLRAILTAHAHHDHALDTAAVWGAQKKAVVVGTPSVAKLVQSRGVPADHVCVPIPGKKLTFGPYTVTAYEVDHAPSVFFLHWILDRPLKRGLPGPAWFGSYKDNKNLSYLVEYGGRRILIHPSGGTPRTSVDAEIVFLGLGRVGRRRESEAWDYWQAAVSRQATTVVPIHWDQFTSPVGEPLTNTTWLLDNVRKGRRRVCGYAEKRPDLEMIRLDAKAVLSVPVRGAVHGASEGASHFCDSAKARH